MSTKKQIVLLKRSSVAGAVPKTDDLAYGELAINYNDGLLHWKDSKGVIQHTPLKDGGGEVKSHTHGNIDNNGLITGTAATIASGDSLLIADSSASNLLAKSLTFGTSDTTFLRNDGTWGAATVSEIDGGEFGSGEW